MWCDALPAACRGEVFAWLGACDLVRLTLCCRDFGETAIEAAKTRTTTNRFPNYLRALRYTERLESFVGPAPPRSWRDEWISLERQREFVLPGTESSPEKSLQYVKPSAEWKYANGWPKDLADGHTLLMTKFKAVLGEAIRHRNATFAASVFLVSSVLTSRASVEPIAPPSYNDLDGPYGLRRADPVWAQLPTAPLGTTFETTTPLEASASRACLTPDGFRAPIIDVKGHCDDVQYQPQDSDVVCFISKPHDSIGFHSLVRTAATKHERQFDLPPLATVTLVNVQEPLTWKTQFQDSAPQFYVNRRLYTVHVSYL